MKIYLNKIILLALLANSAAFAYVSGKTPVNEKLVYCPEQLVCSEAGKMNSCKFDQNYWDHLYVNGETEVIAGEYKFRGVFSTVHSNSGTGVICSYKNDSSGIKYISLYEKHQNNLEAYNSSVTSWVLNNRPGLGAADCFADSPQACPLHERSAFVIINDKAVWNVFPYVNGSPIYDFEQRGKSIVRYEDALTKCESEKFCKVDIMALASGRDITSYFKIGSIVVDMDNKLKIIRIDSLKSSGYEIRKIEPYNTIEIKKIELNPSNNLLGLQIVNKINSDIVLSVNYTSLLDKFITASSQVDIFVDRVQQVCVDNNECKVDVKLVSGGSATIGSIIIDTQDNMKIVRVESTHPSEIIINMIDAKKVEVRYYPLK